MKIYKRGMSGPEIRIIQNYLRSAGFKVGIMDGVFGRVTEQAVMAFQKRARLTPDGEVGPETLSELGIDFGPGKPEPKPEPGPIEAPHKPHAPTAETPWMDWMKKHDGWTEAKNDKALAKFWKYTNHKADTVKGRENAWCAMAVNAALEESGYSGNGRADALSFTKYGVASSFRPGCVVVLEHPNGGHHVAFGVRQTADGMILFGGNQSDGIREKAYGKAEKILAIRWPVKA